MKSCIPFIFFYLFFFNVFRASAQEVEHYGGIAIGPETALALPKIGSYFINDKKHYVGFDLSPWFIFSFWLSANANVGLIKNNISFESGLSYWYNPASESSSGSKTGASHHMCFNPKIGFHSNLIWLKFGPGFVFDKNYRNMGTELIDITKFGGLRWNFELLFKLKHPN